MSRILIIEDDPVNSLTLIRQLEDLGYTVTSVDNGEKALDIAHTIPPQVILLNIYIRGMDSHTFIRNVKKNQRCIDVKVIALTSELDKEANLSASRASCDDLVTNPIDFNALNQKIKLLSQFEKQVRPN
jgi:CheY-like chemotaxis protein